jgi:hypothetical protein
MSKFHAFGTTFSWNSQTVANLRAINGIELTAAEADVSDHQSTSTFTEFLPGMLTAGKVTLEGWMNPSDTNGQVAMMTDFLARTSRTGVITFPSASGATWTFTGYITAIKVGDAPTDSGIPFTATVSPTGVPVFAVAAVTGMSAVGFSNAVLMMPTFAIGTYEYVVTITAGQTSTVVTPVDDTGGEVITITTDGAGSQVVATGEASSACTLDVDDVAEIVVTISTTNCVSKVYTFHCAVLAE